MGFFDFLKRKKDTEKNISVQAENNKPIDKEDFIEKDSYNQNDNSKETLEKKSQEKIETKLDEKLFNNFKKYGEYVNLGINLMYSNSFAPFSAYEESDGTIKGFLFINGKRNTFSFSVEKSISKMEEKFESLLKNNQIKSYIIGYHSQYNNDDNHTPSTKDENFKAISYQYNFKDQKGHFALPYVFQNEEFYFQGFKEFTEEQNQWLFELNLEENKNYFSEREEINAPTYTNDLGIKIEQANQGSLGNLWGGIFGFEKFNSQKNLILEILAYVSVYGSENLYKDTLTKSINERVKFLSVEEKKQQINTFFPIVETNKIIEVTTKTISEWQHMKNIEAVIDGNGRDTFGVTFFATDYSYNREKYHNSKNLDINLSGIILHLEKFEHDNSNENEPKFSEEFTGYFDNNQLNYLGGFDFIGEIKAVEKITFKEPISVEGYILTMKLITHEIEDFFTIDMFINPKNTELKNFEVGMKVTGLFLLQGKIA